jgi:hypothetical protein
LIGLHSLHHDQPRLPNCREIKSNDGDARFNEDSRKEPLEKEDSCGQCNVCWNAREWLRTVELGEGDGERKHTGASGTVHTDASLVSQQRVVKD